MKKIMPIILIVLTILLIISVIIIFFCSNKKQNYINNEINYNYFKIISNEKCGIIDKTGKVIIEPECEEIEIPNPGKAIFICYQNDEIIVRNKTDQIFKDINVTAISGDKSINELAFEKEVLKYKENNLYGLIDFNGKKLTKPIYQEITSLPYKEGEILVKKDNKYGVINNRGEILIEPEYDEIVGDGYVENEYTNNRYENTGYIIAKTTNQGLRYGYINNKWEKYLETTYNNISRISKKEQKQDVYLLATENGRTGLIKNKEQIIQANYQEIQYDTENQILIVKRNTLYGIKNIQGKNVIEVNYDKITIDGAYIEAEKEGETKKFYLDGTEVTENEYQTIYAEAEYFISVDTKGAYGILDQNKNVITKNNYTYIEHLYDKYFIAQKNNMYGIIDADGNTMLDHNFSNIQKIQDMNLIQTITKKDHTTEIYNMEFKKLGSLSDAETTIYDKYIKLYSNENTLFFDKEGTEKTANEIYDNKLYTIKKNNKWGFVDAQGKEVISTKYERTTELNSYGFAGIKENNKWGIINSLGEIVLEPTYTFEKGIEPEFLGKYYKTRTMYNEIFYTDDGMSMEEKDV